MFIPLSYSWKFLQQVNVYPVHVQVSTTRSSINMYILYSVYAASTGTMQEKNDVKFLFAH